MRTNDITSFPDVIIPLFHVDSFQRNMKFVSGGFIPSGEDGKWCGKGMYFWDNLSNVKYWVRDKQRKNPKITVDVAKSSLICSQNDILDLTDEETSIQMKLAAISYAKKYGVTINIKNNGNVINFIHDVICRENAITSPDKKQSIFSVVKVAGYYKNINKEGLVASNESYKKSSATATAHMRLIYAVRKSTLLQKRKVINLAEEEIPNDLSFWLKQN